MKKCFKYGQAVASNEKNCPYCRVTLRGLEYCPKCNSKVDGDPEFCSNCGARLYTICISCKKN